MNSGLVLSSGGTRSTLQSIFTARPDARKQLRDFFSSHIRNRNTRRAYMEAVRQFAAFCAEIGIAEIAQVEAVHVAAFVERQLLVHSRPTVKLRLAALRMLFEQPGLRAGLVTGKRRLDRKSHGGRFGP
jgi:hypothetical protein